MKKIDNISTIEGRVFLQDLFRNLRFERQYNGFRTLFIIWRICTANIDSQKYIKNNLSILHKLGTIRGTVVFLEEIINRFYFSTILSLVYFGAAVLLVLLGINKFYDKADDSIVIYGIMFEVVMLIFVFIVMLFSPSVDVNNITTEDDPDEELGRELLDEIGEISKDFAITSSQLDKITEHLITLSDKQNETLTQLNTFSQTLADITNPNPKMIEIMSQTNDKLSDFNQQITTLINSTRQLQQDQIQNAIRTELEKILANRISLSQ